jgi:hypothetical protein
VSQTEVVRAMVTLSSVRRDRVGRRFRLVATAVLACAGVLLPLGTASGIEGDPTVPVASPDEVFPRTPLWVYGHSYTALPGVTNTPGKEWMPQLAAELGNPSWKTFGVRSSRIVDTYGDVARQAPRGPVRDSAWPVSRHGAVVVQSEFNDMVNPAPNNVQRSLSLTPTAVANYGQTLQASLALVSSSARADFSTARSSGRWTASSGAAYAGGSLVWTTTPGAYRETTVDVGSSGTVWVVTWDVSRATSNPSNGRTTISVDGKARVVVPEQVAAWEAIWTGRFGGYRHTSGPRATKVSGLTSGRHVIRVTKGDRGPGAVCLDQVLVQSAAPVPALVVKDPSPRTSGRWVTAPANRPIVIANQQQLNAQIDAVTRQFANVATVSLAGAGPEDFGWDGLHLSDLGMQYEADLLARAFRRLVGSYRVASMYR